MRRDPQHKLATIFERDGKPLPAAGDYACACGNYPATAGQAGAIYVISGVYGPTHSGEPAEGHSVSAWVEKLGRVPDDELLRRTVWKMTIPLAYGAYGLSEPRK